MVLLYYELKSEKKEIRIFDSCNPYELLIRLE